MCGEKGGVHIIEHHLKFQEDYPVFADCLKTCHWYGYNHVSNSAPEKVLHINKRIHERN